jgi:hypothetical protein
MYTQYSRTHAHAHTHTHIHALTCARMQTHTHTHTDYNYSNFLSGTQKDYYLHGDISSLHAFACMPILSPNNTYRPVHIPLLYSYIIALYSQDLHQLDIGMRFQPHHHDKPEIYLPSSGHTCTHRVEW